MCSLLASVDFISLLYIHDHPFCLMTTCALVNTKEILKWKIYLPTSMHDFFDNLAILDGQKLIIYTIHNI
ncbi:hypothetical protein Hanom_Chr17g01582031 [Helianthus anomalus]